MQSGVVATPEDLRALIKDGLKFPILVIPWGEHSGAPWQVIQCEDDLERKLRLALRDSIHKNQVHAISKYNDSSWWRTVESIKDPMIS